MKTQMEITSKSLELDDFSTLNIHVLIPEKETVFDKGYVVFEVESEIEHIPYKETVGCFYLGLDNNLHVVKKKQTRNELSEYLYYNYGAIDVTCDICSMLGNLEYQCYLVEVIKILKFIKDNLKEFNKELCYQQYKDYIKMMDEFYESIADS